MVGMKNETIEIDRILSENDKRLSEINKPFNPISGKGSTGTRKIFKLSDYPTCWLPISMFSSLLIKKLVKYGSISNFISKEYKITPDEQQKKKVENALIRLRIKHDFPFWCALLVYIKPKGGGDDVRFILSLPQRDLVERFEKKRLAGLPIRMILLKARQWGGSTCTQLYMAWLQIVHCKGLNSLIIAHQGTGSDEIKDMFDKMISYYPIDLLYKQGDSFSPNEAKIRTVGKSGNISRIPQRNCKIKIGTAEKPDSCRGGDYNLVHLSEVGIWKKTEGKSPEDIVRSACSGILLKKFTMIVMESTANGTGNFFHKEFEDANNPDVPSQFEAIFVSWFDIPQYSMDFISEQDKREFAEKLYKYRESDAVMNSREEPGKYLWYLWNKGATLEAINWYITERSGKSDHAIMASEYPSDYVEAFVHSGQMVFDKYKVEAFKKMCRPPMYRGEIVGKKDCGIDALKELKFVDDNQGCLAVWELPETEQPNEIIKYRYLTVVDIGGRSQKADWSVIVVFDRLDMIDGDRPRVVAQWYGHCDIDILAWKAVQVAAFYDNSLLVIESNTLETHDKERQIEGGDQSQYVLNQIGDIYPNLYARRQSEDEIRQGAPRKYGFHTNVATKPMIISNLIKVVREHLYTERDKRCLDEYLVYEKKKNNAYGARDGCHDDILMTRAIGLHICFNEMDMPKIIRRDINKRKQKISLVSEAVF